jgi:hypothetical protein
MQQNVTMLPLFVMLSYLELRLVTGKVLISLLQKSPVLKTLVIEVQYFINKTIITPLALYYVHTIILIRAYILISYHASFDN